MFIGEYFTHESIPRERRIVKIKIHINQKKEEAEMLTLNLCKNDAGRGMILYIDSCVKYSPINIDMIFKNTFETNEISE
jgi:hypothetical protein